jgi:glutamate 5-kinase
MQIDFNQLQTIVVKIGTNLLSGQQAFEGRVMESVVKDLCALKKERGFNILLVSSGAVGCGMKTLGLSERPRTLPEKQAVAAVGQATLMHYYENLFRVHGDHLSAAQVLLSLHDLDDRQSYLNVRNTLHALFELEGVVPVVNENDSTGVEELRFGDNDTLSAKIAAKINADLLIILSDVDGLHEKNPQEYPDAPLLEEVAAVTPEIEALAGGTRSHTATGGMRTKLEAAKIACAAGVPVVIANGHRDNVIHHVLGGAQGCTTFLPAPATLPHRKRWIAFGRAVQGALVVDDGARRALVEQGKSLLAAGIVGVEGDFNEGDGVDIRGKDGEVFARALVNYAQADLQRIKGKKSMEIAAILGYNDFDEVVHRDNMALL